MEYIPRVKVNGPVVFWAFYVPSAIPGPRQAPRGGELKPAPDQTRFGSPNPQTRGAKTAPVPTPVGSDTRGFRVQTRPAAIFESNGVRCEAVNGHGRKVPCFGIIEDIWELEYRRDLKMALVDGP
jgi:hypothetical protein